MLRGSFERAAMAILLMGLMIAPLGICLQHSTKGSHNCCMQTESSHSMRTNCCILRTQLPANFTAPILSETNPSKTSDEYTASVQATGVSEQRAVAVIPPLSPPTGEFILRI